MKDSDAWQSRFWSLVDTSDTDGCWPWLGCVNSTGYGAMRGGLGAHRYAYTLLVGEISEGLCVMHSCDNRICCQPKHLRLGTHKENMADCARKDRHNRGARRKSARLTDQMVTELRHGSWKHRSYLDLAAELRVSKSTLYLAKTYKTWKHLP